MEKDKKVTALYCRLSKDDGSNSESLSIRTQKSMLMEYATRNGFGNCQYYVDDGYSGTNSDRPAFQELLDDIREGKVATVITKDQSRLGRNHIETGTYMEIFFPEHGVRYIAINDGYDSNEQSQMDIAPFRNIINEMYAKDTSRKIKSALRTRKKSGKYISSGAPFGYQKDPADHNHLVIDPNTAPVVEYIYSMAEEGLGLHRIAKRLHDEKVLKPCYYKKEMFGRFIDDEKMYDWDSAYISQVLHSPVYAGHIIYEAKPTVSMKSKKRRYIPFEERAIVPNALMKNKIIGICPNCGANVVEREKGWFCENRECRFVLWKDNAFFKRLGKRLDSHVADKLLRDGRVRLKDCKSAKGKTYNATVLLSCEADGRSKFSLEFEGGC